MAAKVQVGGVHTVAEAEGSGRSSEAPLEALVGPERYPLLLARGVGAYGAVAAAIALLAMGVRTSPIPGLHLPIVVGLLVADVMLGLTMVVWPRYFSPITVRFITSGGLVGAVIVLYFLGPLTQFDAAYIAVGLCFLPLWLVRSHAIVPACLAAVGYGVLLATKGYSSPISRWIVVIGLGVSAAVLFEWVMNRVRELSRQERVAHLRLEEAHLQLEAAHDELANLNQTLETRVATQVADIESLNRLRRFLSPQVAEAVLNSGDEAVLRPHGCEIAVFFCDLRGFTGFAAGAKPEVVVQALDDYYNVVGNVLREHDATVGTFAGDGIMAYLNDPVPCEDPAWTAVQMALDLRYPMAKLLTTWTQRGFDLGYGIGIAYGNAMLGTIGFEGRYDYTALGSVVNLVSRLCGEAGRGEVLVDTKTAEALVHRVTVTEREVTLKGFPSMITAFQVVG